MTLSFEKAIEKLEKLVDELETGDLPLDKALAKFEEGIKLSRLCQQKLDETEKKVSMLTENADGVLNESPMTAPPHEAGT
jgi:exodeoxyribonuclease VII small subunit